MSLRRDFRFIGGAVLAVSLSVTIVAGFSVVRAQAPSETIQGPCERKLIRIREVVSVRAQPDTAYLLMTVGTERSQLAEAVRENEKQLQAFVAALKQIGISPAALSIKNFVVAPVIMGRGFSLARNLIITVEQINTRPADEFAQLRARVQDVGARFGSSCITCIGSG